MFCATCGTQNSDTSIVCTACGRTLAQPNLNASPVQSALVLPPPPPPGATTAYGNVGAAVANAPIPIAPPPAAAVQPFHTMNVFGKIGIVAVSLLSIVYAFAAPVPDNLPETQAGGYRIGRLITAIFIPWLISYLIAGRRKNRKPNLFGGLFCGIGMFVLLANAATSLGALKVESTDQKISRLMREAAGVQPVRKSIFGEPKMDTQIRGLFKELFSANKDYQQAVDKLDMKQTTVLATPQSFADPDSAARGLQVLHTAYDLDTLQEQRIQKTLDDFRDGFDDLPASEREVFSNSFNEGLSKAMPARHRAITTEKAWIDSMDDVYNYAQSHHTDFTMRDSQVAVNDNVVREEFNSRIRAMNAARTEFMQAKADFDKLQNTSLNKMGMSREQTGMH